VSEADTRIAQVEQRGGLAALRGYAGLAALALGGVYTYGALIKATQLRGAEQSVTDTLPLVPLEQLLVTGISSALPLLAIVVFGLLGILFIQEHSERRSIAPEEEVDEEPKREPRAATESAPPSATSATSWASRHRRPILCTVGVMFLALVILTSPPGYLVLLTYVGVLMWWRWPPDISRQQWLAFISVSWVALTLVANYVDPRTLPEVSIETERGDTLEGTLLVAAGDTWYVGTGEHEFEGVQSAEIEESSVDSREDDDESVFELLTGHKLLGLPRD